MDYITIDKDVPLPLGRATKYPFHEMKIGDSFFVPNVKAVGVHHYKPKLFMRRTVIENGIKGVRVWRYA